MKKFLLLSYLLINIFFVNAQTFNKKPDTLTKSEKSSVYKYTIKKAKINIENSENFILKINADPQSSLNPIDYTIDFKNIQYKTLNSQDSIHFYIELKADKLPDRERFLKLNLIAQDTVNNKRDVLDSLTIVIKANEEIVRNYNYLAYIGTNFDLVDGIKANNLFFAANVYLEPELKKMGWYLSLYGNRSFTATDTSNVFGRDQIVERISADSVRVYRENATLVRNSTSDNLGAHTSFLWNFIKLNENTKLMISASTEFIWRRTEVASQFKDAVATDTVDIARSINTSILQAPQNFTTYSNEFAFSFGPGIFLSHQTKNMSVRLQASAGYISEYIPQYKTMTSVLNSSYDNEQDFYFLGRAWITEATSGITLQAEVTNTFKNSRPFFVVTLSKAINFKNLGNIFSPITTR